MSLYNIEKVNLLYTVVQCNPVSSLFIFISCKKQQTNKKKTPLLFQSANIPETVGSQDSVPSGVGSIAGINGTVCQRSNPPHGPKVHQ